MGLVEHLLGIGAGGKRVRVGGVTYYMRDGQLCACPSRRKKRRVRTEGEQAVAGRFTEVRKLWRVCRHAMGELAVWQVAAREAGMRQGDTLFHRLNAGCVRAGEGVWAFPAFRFSAGSLDVPVLRGVSREGWQVEVEWEVDGEDRAGAGWGDRVYVGYFYGAAPRSPGMVAGLAEAGGAPARRRDGKAVAVVPPMEGEEGKPLHVYLFFGNEQGTRFSPSAYGVAE